MLTEFLGESLAGGAKAAEADAPHGNAIQELTGQARDAYAAASPGAECQCGLCR